MINWKGISDDILTLMSALWCSRDRWPQRDVPAFYLSQTCSKSCDCEDCEVWKAAFELANSEPKTDGEILALISQNRHMLEKLLSRAWCGIAVGLRCADHAAVHEYINRCLCWRCHAYRRLWTFLNFGEIEVHLERAKEAMRQAGFTDDALTADEHGFLVGTDFDGTVHRYRAIYDTPCRYIYSAIAACRASLKVESVHLSNVARLRASGNVMCKECFGEELAMRQVGWADTSE